ncbi:DUF1800 domain-containing protein [Sinisalibacter aestuarii]|uniref:DUF1800 domain-containing protein n=1 Tax=Sinisalibacter aestuarii TaxID=2949426 RepID=A0ABQ5LUI9_9RHOB|nr:DUF1800 domain-containing protein [Sinisalibacter aestuarii]GKY87787.1 hypothetical protein STA1M1_16560 [Sinisalibacter aestuarii]
MSSATIAAIRFGYGLSAGQPAPGDAGALSAALAAPDAMAARFPVTGMAGVFPLIREYNQARRASRQDEPGGEDRFQAARRNLRLTMLEGLRAQLMRAVLAPDGMRERLHAFWSDHFTVRAKGVRFIAAPSAFAEDAIRPHITGSFPAMLRAAVTHPAMLAYLDQNRSIGPDSPAGQRQGAGLNENLAREVLELHTLGVDGGYAQGDVTQFAELLTGLTFDVQEGFLFRPRWAEPGAETVLGTRYGGAERARLDEVFAALDDIALHPATARHLARKLAVHFVSDRPDPDLVATLAAAYTAGGGALMPVYEALLAHPAAWVLPFAKARQPWDFMVASLRALGATEAALAGLGYPELRKGIRQPLAHMGQPYQAPPGPDGWPEEAEAWITPPALAERIGWAMALAGEYSAALPDPRAFVETALGGTASETLLGAVRAAESREAAVALVLASAEFNRR